MVQWIRNRQQQVQKVTVSRDDPEGNPPSLRPRTQADLPLPVLPPRGTPPAAKPLTSPLRLLQGENDDAKLQDSIEQQQRQLVSSIALKKFVSRWILKTSSI